MFSMMGLGVGLV